MPVAFLTGLLSTYYYLLYIFIFLSFLHSFSLTISKFEVLHNDRLKFNL